MRSDTIPIKINQCSYSLPRNASLQDAVDVFAASPPFALALNKEFVPKSQYREKRLNDGDEIEIISPITGG